MTSKTALINYGSGNLRSAEKALVRAAGGTHEIVVTDDPEAIARADRIVLPGVGAFAACMSALAARDGVVEALNEVVGKGAPFLGICVGEQLLATRGLEFGETAGLGWIPGDVRKLTDGGDPAIKIPHMGWNSLTGVIDHPVFAGLKGGQTVYFTHSFAFFPQDSAHVAAYVEHGERFPAAVARDNIAGVQFHPEKSQAVGLDLLARFLEWRP